MHKLWTKRISHCLMGAYLLIEPPIQNIGTLTGAVIALAGGYLWLGLGLLVWTTVDTFTNVYAGMHFVNHGLHRKE